jgi:hypothetical protein
MNVKFKLNNYNKGRVKIKKQMLLLFTLVFIMSSVLVSSFGLTDNNVKAAGLKYYVDGTNGNDSNDGAAVTTAWKTLSKTNIEKLVAGDTLYVLNGIYKNQDITAQKAGNAKDGYITFMNYPGHKPILDGSTNPVLSSSYSYIIFDGLTVQNSKHVGFSFWEVDHIIVRNCTFKNINKGLNNNGCYMGGVSYSIIQNSTFDTCSDNRITQDKDWIHVENSIGAKNLPSHHNLFENLSITKGPHSSIMINRGYKNIIRNCDFYNDWQKNVEIVSQDDPTDARNIVENNKIHKARLSVMPEFPTKGGIGIHIATDFNIIRKNLIYDNAFYGIVLDAYGGGFVAPSSTGNKIYNNTFSGNGFIKVQPGTDFPANSGMTITPWGYIYPIGNNVIKNNIFYNNGNIKGGGTNVELYIDPVPNDSDNTNSFIGNDIFNKNQTKTIYTAGQTVKQTVLWAQKKYPTFNKNITTNPKLANAGAFNFILQTDSPSINTGVALTTATNSGKNTTTLTVSDAGYFSDGFGVPTDELGHVVAGDQIKIGTAAAVTIKSIDYKKNKITLEAARTWSKGASVNLVYTGNAPDKGAIEAGTEKISMPGLTK